MKTGIPRTNKLRILLGIRFRGIFEHVHFCILFSVTSNNQAIGVDDVADGVVEHSKIAVQPSGKSLFCMAVDDAAFQFIHVQDNVKQLVRIIGDKLREV